MTIENVVAEHEAGAMTAYEVGADDEGLGETFRPLLDRVADLQAPLRPVAEQLPIHRKIARCADDQDLTDARQHQRR